MPDRVTDRTAATAAGDVDCEHATDRSVQDRIAEGLADYSTAAEEAWCDARALFDSCAFLWRGMQNWQFTCISLSQEILREVNRARWSYVRCGSVPEAVRLQRAVSLELMRRAMSAHVTLLDLAVQAGRDAACPLRDRGESSRQG
ncbi:MAG: hypothetical protein JOZ42_05220 [Acetobacteraceae bacterium]|nr:hypothetical protein [Acetobacteraceae bacterium]